MRILKTGALLAVFIGAMSASAAEAVPITGSFTKGGAFLPWNSVTNTQTTLGAANALEFQLLGVSNPGAAGSFVVTDNSGSFVALAPVASTGFIKDFTFSGAPSALFPAPPVPVFELVSVSGLTVDLLSIAFGPGGQTATTIDLVGTVLFKHAGFDDTPGVVIISGNTTNGVTFAFGSTQSAVVPEPASMALLGLGMLGLGAIRRKKTLVG